MGGLKHQGSALETREGAEGEGVPTAGAGRGAPGSRIPGLQPGYSKKKEYRTPRRRGHWQPALPRRLPAPIALGAAPRSRPRPAPLAGGRDPYPGWSAPRPAPPGPRLLCRQRAAATQRARTPSERPRLRVLPPGGGLMSAPAAPAARHRRPGREGAARARPASSAASCRPGGRCRALPVLRLNQFPGSGQGRGARREGGEECTHSGVNHSKSCSLLPFTPTLLVLIQDSAGRQKGGKLLAVA